MSITLKSVNELTGLGEEWLIRGIWPSEGVGIIAAEPKSGKTWLALELAVCVASGAACLGEFPVETPSTVLFFNGEDSERIQKDRLANIMRAKGLNYSDLAKLKIIRADSLRLDIVEDLNSLRAIVETNEPKLVILDPFVRLHRINENNSAEVAELLGRLRDIQKDFNTAIILVHHQTKAGGKNTRGGTRMRGSSELHAWGDANLFLNKQRNGELALDIELRTSTSVTDVPLELIAVNGGVHLQDVSPLPIKRKA